MGRPPTGSMIWWRFKKQAPCGWVFGYVSYVFSGVNLIRLGTYNGDLFGGAVVDFTEIEWESHG